MLDDSSYAEYLLLYLMMQSDSFMHKIKLIDDFQLEIKS